MRQPRQSALYRSLAHLGCYRGAIEGAVTKVNNPLLTAVHTGRPPRVTAMAK